MCFDFTISIDPNQHIKQVDSNHIYYQVTISTIIMCEVDQTEEKDSIEHYLRALRKKVEHQVRNPFELTFANFTFEELSSWKNNVLQLDATSRLYGQRVDFLHCGALQIMGSVLSNEAAVQETSQHKQQIKKTDAYDNAPYERNLEQPQRLNSEVELFQTNFTLWRQICRKRDALHQMMLNQLTVDHELRLELIKSDAAATNTIYESIITEEPTIYLKLLDFRNLSLKFMNIFKEIQETVSEANIFMISCGNSKARGQSMRVESLMDFDFQCLEQEPFQFLHSGDLQQGIGRLPQLTLVDGEQFAQIANPNEEQDDSDEYLDDNDTEDYFQMDDWNRNEKGNKNMKAKQNRKRDGQRKEKREEMVDFKGMPLERHLVLSMEMEQYQQKYIGFRDFLLLRFIKYAHPFPKKQKKNAGASKFRPPPENTFFQTQAPTFESATSLNPLNDSIGSWNPVTNLSRFSQHRFKEAALPIKQMKKKIKQRVQIGQDKKLFFRQIKETFKSQQPLDIFISVLHIAAQEQAMVVL